MKRQITSIILILILGIGLIPFVFSATDVDTSAMTSATQPSSHRLTTYANGNWWSFYYDGANVVFRTSIDGGDTWSAKTTLHTGLTFDSIWVDHSTDQITYARPLGGTTIFNWRNGTLENDGSITWGASEASVQIGRTGTVDSTGFIMRTVIGPPDNIFVCLSINDSGTHHVIAHRYNGTHWSASPIFDFSSVSGNPLSCNILETTLGLVLTYSTQSQVSGVINLVTSGDMGDTWGAPMGFDTTYNFLASSFVARSGTIHYLLKAGLNGLYYTYDYGDPAVSAQFDLTMATAVTVQLSKLSSDILIAYYAVGNEIRTRHSLDEGATWSDPIIRENAESTPSHLQSVYSHSTKSGLTWTNTATNDVRFLEINLIAESTSFEIDFSASSDFFRQHRVCDVIYLFKGDAVNIPVNVSYAFGIDRVLAVALQFTDTINNVTLVHNVTRNTWVGQNGTVFNGQEGVSFGVGTSQIDPNNLWGVFNYPIALRDGMIDVEGIQFQIRVYDNETAWSEWGTATIKDGLAVNIYILGGLKSWTASGNAGLAPQGDTFEMYSDENGSVQVNQTWRKLQAYHFQYSWKIHELAGFTSNYDEYFQTSEHNGGTDLERDSGAGDWTVYNTIYYCDRNTNTWVNGWEAQLEIAEGDVGGADQWTSFNIAWYRQGVLMTTDKVYFFVEPDEKAEVRVWTDLWFNRENASRTHGGRIYPYYYGMEDKGSPFMFWNDWTPFFQNATVSSYFNATLGSDGRVMTVRDLDFMKIGINITRGADTGDGQLNNPFRFSLVEYEISEITQAQGSFVGIPTPIKVSTVVPDFGVTGFLQPLWTALSRLGGVIIDALRSAGTALWGFVASQAPWFTGFWELAYAFIVQGLAFIPDLTEIIFTAFEFATPYVGFIDTGLDIFRGTADTIATALSPLEGNFDAWLFLIFLGVVVFPFIQRINDGDWEGVKEEIGTLWATINALLMWVYRMVRFVIDFIVGLIPL